MPVTSQKTVSTVRLEPFGWVILEMSFVHGQGNPLPAKKGAKKYLGKRVAKYTTLWDDAYINTGFL
jgi:hypothetical protein